MCTHACTGCPKRSLSLLTAHCQLCSKLNTEATRQHPGTWAVVLLSSPGCETMHVSHTWSQTLQWVSISLTKVVPMSILASSLNHHFAKTVLYSQDYNVDSQLQSLYQQAAIIRPDGLNCAQWRHGEFGGVGMERFADGALYVGEYEAGVAQGLGICLFLNGDTYEVNPKP